MDVVDGVGSAVCISRQKSKHTKQYNYKYNYKYHQYTQLTKH